MLRVIPLGGLGEIGLNSMVFECQDQLLLVDAGLLFPPPELPGVELIIPDFGYLRDAAAQLGAVLLTHAHEDHVGALPFLLRERSVPVYGDPAHPGAGRRAAALSRRLRPGGWEGVRLRRLRRLGTAGGPGGGLRPRRGA